MIILYFFIGFFSYCLLGSLFYYIALGIYAKTGFFELVATMWFQSEKTVAIALWAIWIPFWVPAFVIYFALKIMFFPIAFIHGEIDKKDYYSFSIKDAEKRWDKSMANEWRHPY